MAVRRIVRYFFGINALILLSMAYRMATARGASLSTTILGTMAAAFVAGAIFAVAWATNLKPFRGAPSSRLWGLAASVLLVVEGLAILVLGGQMVWRVGPLPIVAPIFAGLLGLFAFAQNARQAAAVAASPRPRIAGDRTSRVTDKLFSSAAVLMSIGATVFWANYARDHGIERHSQVPYVALVLLAGLFAVFTHECGHAVAGWIFDMRLLSFNAGPFTWQKQRGRWSFSFSWRKLFRGSGSVNLIPTHPDQPAWHEVCMILGGPGVNLWLGFGLTAALLVPDKVDPEYRRLFELMATYSLMAAIYNLMPLRLEKGSYSDGASILQLATKSPMVDVRRALKGVQATLVTERRPRDLDIATIERAASYYPTDYTGLHLKLCGVQHYSDLGMRDKAAEWLAEAEAMVERHGIPVPAAIHTTFIVENALLRKDAAAVARWFERMEQKNREEKKLQRESVDSWLAHASLLWMQGRIEEAKACLAKADAEAQRLPKAGAYEYERSRCERMQAALEAPALTTGVPPPPPVGDTEFAAQAQPEWSYTNSYAAESYAPESYAPESYAAAPVQPAVAVEEPEDGPAIHWPRSLGRKYGAA